MEQRPLEKVEKVGSVARAEAVRESGLQNSSGEIVDRPLEPAAYCFLSWASLSSRLNRKRRGPRGQKRRVNEGEWKRSKCNAMPWPALLCKWNTCCPSIRSVRMEPRTRDTGCSRTHLQTIGSPRQIDLSLGEGAAAEASRPFASLGDSLKAWARVAGCPLCHQTRPRTPPAYLSSAT